MNLTGRNKNEITRTIIIGLLMTGGIAIAATDPLFLYRIMPKLLKLISYKIKNRKDRKKYYDTFTRLKNKGLVKMVYRNKQLYISLTREGRKKAGKYRIDDLKIQKPKRWDKKWRILIFDIEEKKLMKREALRGKIKQLGLFQLQRSVWVCPYRFQKEIETLRGFFGLTDKEMKTITASEIENDLEMRTFFGIK